LHASLAGKQYLVKSEEWGRWEEKPAKNPPRLPHLRHHVGARFEDDEDHADGHRLLLEHEPRRQLDVALGPKDNEEANFGFKF